MREFRLNRRQALTALAGGAAYLSAPAIITARGSTPDRVSYATGWLPEAEQGGFFQAVAAGIYAEHGLDVEIKKGGPQIDINTPFLAGKTDFIESSAFAVFNYLQQELPGIAVASIMQKDPHVLLSHPGEGNDTLEALKGKPILVAGGSRDSYWVWLKAKYGYTDDQMRPYTFNLAPFLADKKLTQQGLLTSEPYDMKAAGVDPVIHLLADHGFGNYNTTILTSPKMVAEKKDVVARFVEATIRGWASYLNGDATPGNGLIKAGNADMDDAKIAFSIQAIKDHGVIQSGDAATLGIGAMSDQRWHDFYAAMVDVGAQPKGLDIAKGYTLDFVNKKVAL